MGFGRRGGVKEAKGKDMWLLAKIYGIDVAASSKWCGDFLRAVLSSLQAMKHTKWYEYKFRTLCVEPNPYRRVDDTPESVRELESCAAHDLASFLELFEHIGTPDGTKLEVAGSRTLAAGWLWLELVHSDGTRMKPDAIKVDRRSVEGIWEREVLCWVSRQFGLYRHAGYAERKMMAGGGDDFDGCWQGVYMDGGDDDDFVGVGWRGEFLYLVGKRGRKRILGRDFSPRVRVGILGPKVKYYTCSMYDGLYACVATGRGRPGDEGRRIVKCEKLVII